VASKCLTKVSHVNSNSSQLLKTSHSASIVYSQSITKTFLFQIPNHSPIQYLFKILALGTDHPKSPKTVKNPNFPQKWPQTEDAGQIVEKKHHFWQEGSKKCENGVSAGRQTGRVSRFKPLQNIKNVTKISLSLKLIKQWSKIYHLGPYKSRTPSKHFQIKHHYSKKGQVPKK
jgi:hypothetical protein